MLEIVPAKNEDMIVTILTNYGISKYYRFFGARDIILQFGHLINFTIDREFDKDSISKMRSLSLIEFPWLKHVDKRLFWSQFLKLFYTHVIDIKKVDIFYFNILLLSIQKWDKSNHKRIICESYINILKYENRLSPLIKCHICNEVFKDNIAFIDELKPTHPKCSKSHPIAIKKMVNFFNTKNSIFLSDDEIERLLEIIMRGF
ncbi:MAG: recombination protein RecO [Sulfurovum sp.]